MCRPGRQSRAWRSPSRVPASPSRALRDPPAARLVPLGRSGRGRRRRTAAQSADRCHGRGRQRHQRACHVERGRRRPGEPLRGVPGHHEGRGRTRFGAHGRRHQAPARDQPCLHGAGAGPRRAARPAQPGGAGDDARGGRGRRHRPHPPGGPGRPGGRKPGGPAVVVRRDRRPGRGVVRRLPGRDEDPQCRREPDGHRGDGAAAGHPLRLHRPGPGRGRQPLPGRLRRPAHHRRRRGRPGHLAHRIPRRERGVRRRLLPRPGLGAAARRRGGHGVRGAPGRPCRHLARLRR